jgi:hypothetical protein
MDIQAYSPIYMAIIDGTGDADPDKYNTSMVNSFCKQLDKLTYSKYFRGPSTLGSEVQTLAHAACKWLLGKWEREPGAKLMLAGYSRGGSAAILAAEMLGCEGRCRVKTGGESILVDSMFLFDAVARHRYQGGEIVPGNVAFCRHAMRSQSPLFVLKYEGSISDHWALGPGSNPTRPLFGHTGLTAKAGVDFAKSTFKGSHGALGGVGWKFVEEDPQCQQDVALWMSEQMKARGVRIDLQNKGCGGPDATRAGATTLVAGYVLDLWLLAYQGLEQRYKGQR